MKTPISRGIPSKEAFWLPDFKKIRRFQDENELPTRNLFVLEDVLKFIFPPKYQPKYYEVSLALIKSLINKKGLLLSNDLTEIIKTYNFSKATFYNRILPRLRRIGLIKIEREITQNLKMTKKKRKMKIRISKTFGNYLMKIADSWLAIVDDVKSENNI